MENPFQSSATLLQIASIDGINGVLQSFLDIGCSGFYHNDNSPSPLGITVFGDFCYT
jgi:hypothetical protein